MEEIRSVPISAPAFTHRGDDGAVYAVWQLEASTDGRSWRLVNAGLLRPGETHVSGRFRPHDHAYRVRFVPAGGGGFIDDGQVIPLRPRHERRR